MISIDDRHTFCCVFQEIFTDCFKIRALLAISCRALIAELVVSHRSPTTGGLVASSWFETQWLLPTAIPLHVLRRGIFNVDKTRPFAFLNLVCKSQDIGLNVQLEQITRSPMEVCFYQQFLTWKTTPFSSLENSIFVFAFLFPYNKNRRTLVLWGELSLEKQQRCCVCSSSWNERWRQWQRNVVGCNFWC